MKIGQVPYREAIDAIMYVILMTRPDTPYVVHQFVTFDDNRGPVHWMAARKVPQYMLCTKDTIIT